MSINTIGTIVQLNPNSTIVLAYYEDHIDDKFKITKCETNSINIEVATLEELNSDTIIELPTSFLIECEDE